MHGDITLGPLMYAMIGLMVVAFAGSVAVTVDVLRPRKRPVPGGWAAKVFWAVPQAGFAVVIVATRLFGQISMVSTVAAVLFFLVIPLQIAYLLVVVFPKPPRAGSEAALESEPLGGPQEPSAPAE